MLFKMQFKENDSVGLRTDKKHYYDLLNTYSISPKTFKSFPILRCTADVFWGEKSIPSLTQLEVSDAALQSATGADLSCVAHVWELLELTCPLASVLFSSKGQMGSLAQEAVEMVEYTHAAQIEPLARSEEYVPKHASLTSSKPHPEFAATFQDAKIFVEMITSTPCMANWCLIN